MFSEKIKELVIYSRGTGIKVGQLVTAVERQYVIDVLISNNLNQCRAAVELGWHRNTLNRNLAELKIDIKALKAERNERKPAASHMATRPQSRFA